MPTSDKPPAQGPFRVGVTGDTIVEWDVPIETAVRRFHESLSTGNATLVDEVLTPDAKASRCPAISASAHN
jgi:hypothetical protein